MNISRRWFIGGGAAFGALSGCRALRPQPSWMSIETTPELTFGVVSDVHVRLAGVGKGLVPEYDCSTLIKTFTWFRDYGADAVMIVGDIADKGLVEELQAVADAWEKVFPGSRAPDGRKVERVFVYGNHDWEGFCYGDHVAKMFPDKNERARHLLRTDMKRSWERIFDEPYSPIYRKDVKGYSFIGAHWQVDHCRGAKEKAFDHVGDWFAANGKALDPSRPFFYCQHPHPKDTVYGSWAWGHDTGVTTKALSAFPNAVAFSGHSHYTLTDERSIWQGAFTALGTSSLRYTGMPYNQYPDVGIENGGGKNGAGRVMARMPTMDGRQGLLVRVYGDCMTFSRRDFMYGRSLGEDWIMPLPSAEPKPFAFAPRAAREVVPEFSANAKVTVASVRVKPRGGKGSAKDAYAFTFQQVRDPRAARAMEYELTFTGADGKATARHMLADGFNMPFGDERTLTPRLTCTIAKDQLPAAPFKVAVRAVTSLGRKSAPIEGEIKS